ncbi:uncharacterized protein MELLADRAFT_61722 [Melampsora larici-populina 98AG31]|uniref:CxC1-like cysteine cluster associated with KDZ transposases domain-containing protein n=1 Tax=Melampsora larici-populina (strain 98AG31 / pathotype 3-4-7) TaxID=747676 RepID=F4RGB3_MELLP|nr:uncharacterized protein MELLADRAFT_61722 [Melampsora larici-populina 98AG31]EGG08694.1 hypothetical protein MELLADRAFT_61722 [Melampsora larici-populina 98AG31]
MAPGEPNNPRCPANALKKPRYNSSQSSRMLSEWEKAEEDWCNKKCESLSRALMQTEVPRPSTSTADDLDLVNEDDELDYDHQFHVEDNEDDQSPSDINESDTKSNDSQQSIASSPGTGSVVTAATGDMNQKRRIREERQWNEVIEPMFKVFMLCKQITFNWSRADWDLDRKAECRCSAAKKRTRHVAMLDILS